MASWGRKKFGELYDSWPRTEDGEPEEPVFLVHCGPLGMEAEMTRSLLDSCGIPSLRLLPGDGAWGEVILGLSGSGVDLYVPASRLEEAKDLLKGEPEDGLQDGI